MLVIKTLQAVGKLNRVDAHVHQIRVKLAPQIDLAPIARAEIQDSANFHSIRNMVSVLKEVISGVIGIHFVPCIPGTGRQVVNDSPIFLFA